MDTMVSGICGLVYRAAIVVDDQVQKTSPWKLVLYTTVIVSTSAILLYKKYQNTSWNLKERFKLLVRKSHSVDEKLSTEMKKLKEKLHFEFAKTSKKEDILTVLPEKGLKKEVILNRLNDLPGTIRGKKNTGACYNNDPELNELILSVYKAGMMTNGLHIKLNPLVRQLEAEVVRMTINLFHGNNDCVGDVTSGGTDSIRHAVLTARRRAKALGMAQGWEMVVPETAHPAFSKAAEEYGIKIIRVKTFPQNHPLAYQVDLKAMKRAINGNTILVVGSCPGFPHGIVDPIEEISKMLEEKDLNNRVGLHVDCCLGGFIAPWMEKTKFSENLKTKFGFDVPRVTSISADTHKYGYGDKGTSVLMYRDFKNWRKHQIFIDRHWSGGLYATSRLPGSFAGKEIAALWATLVYHGQEGFISKTEKILETTCLLIKGIQESCFLQKHLEIMGNPQMMVVAFCAKNPKKLNIYDLHQEMSSRGWYLSALQNPPGIHICVTAIHAETENFTNNFIVDLEDSLNAALNYPQEKRGKSGEGPMYCSNQKFDESLFVEDFVQEYYNIVSEAGPFETSNEDEQEN